MPVLLAVRGIRQGCVEADRLVGAMCVTGQVQLQKPVVERACGVTRGADRAEALRFACRFMKFGGWLHQDAGDLECAMHWTDRASITPLNSATSATSPIPSPARR